MELYYKEFEHFLMNIQIKDYPEQLQDKVKYLLEDGKRLRPILCIIFSGIDIEDIYDQDEVFINLDEKGTGKDTGKDTDKNIIYTMASCIEIIHCLSLVLDDLPSMDNDTMRRGRDSFHSKFGEDYTNFFVYYMFNRVGLSLNLDNIYDTNNTNETKRLIKLLDYIHNLFEHNMNMLIDGQYIDLEWGNNNDNSSNTIYNNLISDDYTDELTIIVDDFLELNSKIDNLFKIEYSDDSHNTEEDIRVEKELNMYLELIKNIELNMKKTSSLFNLSVCVGYVLQIWSKGKKCSFGKISNIDTIDNTIAKKLSIWSNILGYMFQISDDILDMEEDIAKGKPNICKIIGKEETVKLLNRGCDWLTAFLKKPCQKQDFKNVESIGDNNISFNIKAINQIINKILKRVEEG